MLEDLLAKKLVLVTGKGGIGKSLTAASIAQYGSQRGKKVCLVECNQQEQMGPLFSSPKIGHHFTEVSPNLSVINLDPQENFRDFVVLHLGFAKLFDKVFTKPLVKSFLNMLPGIGELTLLGRLYHMSQLDRVHDFDLVVFDGYASGHFLSLLKTPDAVLDSGMVGPVIQEAKELRDFIFNRNLVSVVLVTMPETLIVGEALDFAEKFFKNGKIPFTHLLVNRCLLLSQAEASLVRESSSQDPAFVYMKGRLENEDLSLARLEQGLRKIFSQSSSPPSLLLLPDLGAVNEPLEDSFGEFWLNRGEGLAYV